MNHAYIDASWQEQPGGGSVAGWGLVLLLPGAMPARFQGQLDAQDNNAAELRSVFEAVRVAPVGEALTVHTDNQAVIASVARGRGPHLLTELTHEVHEQAQARSITLSARYAPRTGRHMLTAHDLANDARRRRLDPAAPETGAAQLLPDVQTEVLLDYRTAQAEARISLRRPGAAGQAERLTALLPITADPEVPPSVQVLLAALPLARPGETLSVRRASHTAQALWHKPERALRPGLQRVLQQARQAMAEQGITVTFAG